MLKPLILTFCFGVIGVSTSAQRKDHYAEGNAYINQGKYALAEKTFSEGLELDPENYTLYPSLANAMMLQKKYNSADSVLEVVLEKKPNMLGALWFKGLNYLYWDQDSLSIVFMKRYLKNADPEKHQVANAYYYIGRAYEELLRDTGLLEGELNEMVNYFKKYVNLAEGSSAARRINLFLEQININKPKPYMGRWKFAYQRIKKK